MDRRQRYGCGALFGCGLLSAIFLMTASIAAAQDANHIISPPTDSRLDVRDGGVLAYGFAYHRQGMPPAAQPTIAPRQGWYGYGFPVKTYRWGWFGAARYYPTVFWHRDYQGDTVRWAYRRGY